MPGALAQVVLCTLAFNTIGTVAYVAVGGPGLLHAAQMSAVFAGGGLLVMHLQADARAGLVVALVATWSLKNAALFVARAAFETPSPPARLSATAVLDILFRTAWTVGLLAGLVWYSPPVIQPVDHIVVALPVAIAALALESLADHQLWRWRRDNPDNILCTTGLRAHARHPNYAAAILFGSAVTALLWGRCQTAAAALAMPVVLISTFVAFEIPRMERTRKGRLTFNPAYAEYTASTPRLIPVPGYADIRPPLKHLF